MSTKVKGKKSDPFPIPPEDVYQAVCVDVWDIWTERGSAMFGKQDELVDKTRLVFEINKVCKEKPLVGQPFQVSQVWTASMHPKANLRKFVEAWRGKKLTDEEALEFELEILVGKNCQLQVVHHLASSGNTYANIAGALPLVKGMIAMRPSPDFVRKRDRDAQAKKAVAAASSGPAASDDDEWGPPSVGPDGEDSDDRVPF
jgi:hypothetical protein